MTPLRLRMIEDMRIRNLSPPTQKACIEQVARFARHFGRSPELPGPPEIRTWRLHLAEDKQLAASSIAVAVAALRFLCTVTLRQSWSVEHDIPTGRSPRKLPDVLSPEEVAAFPDAVTQRGAKHLRELAHLARDGIRAVQLYCVNLSGIEAVRPAEEIDSAYAEALREAVACGVEVLAYGVRLSHEEMVIDRRLDVLLNG